MVSAYYTPQILSEGKLEGPTIARCFPPFGFEHAHLPMDVPLIESESSQYVAFIRDAQGLRVLPRMGILSWRLVRITVLRACPSVPSREHDRLVAL